MNSVRHFVDDISAWMMAPTCVIIFVVPAVLGLLWAHRSIYQRIKFSETLIDNGVVGWFFSGVLTIYGITLGLIAVTTWETSSEVAGIASQEASTIAALYRDANGFPSPLGENLRAHLRQYTHDVIEKEWPAQRRGQVLRGAAGVLDAFQRELYSNEPTTESQRILQAEAIRTYNHLIELRRQRMEAVDEGVPEEIWTVIIVGGILTIATSYCFQVQQIRLHLILTTGLATMIGLLVFLIAALDSPYRGAVSVDPTAYQIILDGPMAGGTQ